MCHIRVDISCDWWPYMMCHHHPIPWFTSGSLSASNRYGSEQTHDDPHIITVPCSEDPLHPLHSLCVCVCVCVCVVFQDRVSLCTPGCPGTHFVDQAGLELRNLPASASWVLGLKVCATTLCSTGFVLKHGILEISGNFWLVLNELNFLSSCC